MSDFADRSGPAFPVPDGEAADMGYSGLSKLDWFAGQALSGVLANPRNLEEPPKEVSARAYRYAAAMLAHSRASDKEGAAA